MKTIIAFVGLVAVALAGPQRSVPQTHETVVVKETPSNNIGVGGYNYAYELSDGQTKEESAEVVQGGTDGSFLKVQGTFSFVDPYTNVAYTVNYVADENGYRATGEHLPNH